MKKNQNAAGFAPEDITAACAGTNPEVSNSERITELVFLLDRSGSMCGLESDTIGGFNATLKKHKGMQGRAAVTTILFDDQAEVLHDRVDIQDVALMSEKDYWVRGCTALLDAVGAAVEDAMRVQRYMPKGHKADQVIFVIITDGMENASHKYTYGKVKSLIQAKQEDGWEFLFLGANMDAVAEAANLGIGADRSATYVADCEGSAVAYDAIADATCCMRAMPCAAPGQTGSMPRMGSDWKRKVEADAKKRARR